MKSDWHICVVLILSRFMSASPLELVPDPEEHSLEAADNNMQEYPEEGLVERSVEPRQSSATGRVVIGKDCEYIKLNSITANDGCNDGNKFVIQQEQGVRKQFLILNGQAILGFVRKGKKFADCSSYTEVTSDVDCKVVPGLSDVVLDNSTIYGVLITGGGESGKSTELFLPDTGKTCSLQPLPDSRHRHSLDNVAGKIILCGGPTYSITDTRGTTCLEFLPNSSTGSWVQYATLALARFFHTSFSYQGDLLLMGGADSKTTTEILGKGPQYDLLQRTSHACSIPDESSTILTGGNAGSNRLDAVVRYNMQGYVENLPSLINARRWHGCGYYMDEGNNKVLVVAGGIASGWNRITSTEIFTPGATRWKYGESLPRESLTSTASVSMGEYLLFIGGENNRNQILKFNGTWTEVGSLKTARNDARATWIKLNTDTKLDITACY